MYKVWKEKRKKKMNSMANLFLIVVVFLGIAFSCTAEKRPNIIFLVVESTDGRTWRDGYQNGVLNSSAMPNIKRLEKIGGTSFHAHYSNVPVCCPSRASFWSGRHAHHIPHMHNNIKVGGSWNNYEGLPVNYNNRMDQVLNRSGYDTLLSGKYDWKSGSHSLNVRLNSWTMYTRFPYDMNKTGGWRDETDECRSQGIVGPGNISLHKGDWEVTHKTTEWIRERDYTKKNTKPFFVYSGMNIVHPPYVTNEKYFDKIDPLKIDVPKWPAIEDLHPCDLQSSMLKGCIPSDEEKDAFYSIERRRRIRRIYYAMISEFDAMVGEYMKAVEDAGQWDNTVFIVTSDHGDQQMEHQQHYKMVPYDASASVPMVIYDGRNGINKRSNKIITAPTQLIDIFPTVMEYANVEKEHIPKIDGYSLVPMMKALDDDGGHDKDMEQDKTNGNRPNFVISQFHGCNIAMSWFFIVQPVPCNNDGKSSSCLMKYIRWGTGKQVKDQLFDLTNDPDETKNLIEDVNFQALIPDLDANLKSVVNYEQIAMEVAKYNMESFKWWISNQTDWKTEIHDKSLRWTESWDYAGNDAAFSAIDEWLNAPTTILPCRASLIWPPKVSSSSSLIVPT